MTRRRAKAEPIEPLILQELLMMVERTVPLEIIERWTPAERELARDWAARVHLRAGDNNTVRLKPEPSFVHDGCAERFAPAPGECSNVGIWSNGKHGMQRHFCGELHIIDWPTAGRYRRRANSGGRIRAGAIVTTGGLLPASLTFATIVGLLDVLQLFGGLIAIELGVLGAGARAE
jgi:hypothetical protein